MTTLRRLTTTLRRLTPTLHPGPPTGCVPVRLALLLGLAAGCAATRAVPLRPLRPDTLEHNGWERDCDLLHLGLDITIDFARRSVAGIAENRIRSLANGTTEIRLHGVGLSIMGIEDSRGRPLTYHIEPPFIRIELAEALPFGAEETLWIEYTCMPKTGLFFMETSKDADGFAPQVFSQGQNEDNRHWIPTWDYPNDRATYEARIRVDGDMTVVSNGRLVGVEEHGGGARTFHWRMDAGMPTYLVAVAAGRWERYADEWRGIPVEYYVAPGTGEVKARRAFGETPEMLEFFSELLDYPYPYSKYAQVAVAGFPWSGMENTTITIVSETLIGDAGEIGDLDGDPRLLVAHELAHQWFGGLVTCLGWSHLWLNEAWASYLELLFERHKTTDVNFWLWLERYREVFLARGERTRLPLAADWFSQGAQRTSHEYDKGPWVLRMIHDELGDDAFWRGARAYLRRHANSLVTTADFVRAFFDETGRNVEALVEQWVEAGGYPIYEVSFEQRPDAVLVLTVEQAQELDELVPLFDMPVDVDLHYAGGTVRRHTLRVRHARERFELPLQGALVDVVFDADCRILCDISLDKPIAMWVHQARLVENAVAQWRAVAPVRASARRWSSASGALIAMLGGAEEPLLRAHAAEHCDFPEATLALVRAATSDVEPRVRRESAQTLLQLALRSELELMDWQRELLREHRDTESSPLVRASLGRVLELAD